MSETPKYPVLQKIMTPGEIEFLEEFSCLSFRPNRKQYSIMENLDYATELAIKYGDISVLKNYINDSLLYFSNLDAKNEDGKKIITIEESMGGIQLKEIHPNFIPEQSRDIPSVVLSINAIVSQLLNGAESIIQKKMMHYIRDNKSQIGNKFVRKA